MYKFILLNCPSVHVVQGYLKPMPMSTPLVLMPQLERNYFGTFFVLFCVIPIFLSEIRPQNIAVNAETALAVSSVLSLVAATVILFWKGFAESCTNSQRTLITIGFLLRLLIKLYKFVGDLSRGNKSDLIIMRNWIQFFFLDGSIFVLPLSSPLVSLSRIMMPFTLSPPKAYRQNWVGSLLLVLTAVTPTIFIVFVRPDFNIPDSDFVVFCLLACTVFGIYKIFELARNPYATRRRHGAIAFFVVIIPMLVMFCSDTPLEKNYSGWAHLMTGIFAAVSLTSEEGGMLGQLCRPFLSIKSVDDLECGFEESEAAAEQGSDEEKAIDKF